MGKGLAALTFDKDYQKKRREALNKKPANLQEGLARSGQGLVMVCICFFFLNFKIKFYSFQLYFRIVDAFLTQGVFDGVTGVVTQPISGARNDGVGGFFKGLGKGAVGLVARPTAGLVDFASGSFDAGVLTIFRTDSTRIFFFQRFDNFNYFQLNVPPNYRKKSIAYVHHVLYTQMVYYDHLICVKPKAINF